MDVVLTDTEADEVRAALADRLLETNRYLSGYARTEAHSPCCDADRARAAAIAEQRDGLIERRDALITVFGKIGWRAGYRPPGKCGMSTRTGMGPIRPCAMPPRHEDFPDEWWGGAEHDSEWPHK